MRLRSRILSGSTALASVAVSVSVLSISLRTVAAQERGQTPDISIIAKPIDDTFDQYQIRELKKGVARAPKTPEKESCLFPPLDLVRSPAISATALAVPAKARKEYLAACSSLQELKNDPAEKHLRKAVEVYPKYSVAWVTLGQVLARERQTSASRNACTQASLAEPNYIPAFLCLAELAVREKAWSSVLEMSNRALAIDPTATALAYEYSATANLRMNKLEDAEKSALRALEIDKNNGDAWVHFILAQIYEAKGDRANEILQLREYLKFAGNSPDAAETKQYLTQLETLPSNADPLSRELPEGHADAQKAGGIAAKESAVAEVSEEVVTADGKRPPGCRLNEILPQIQLRVREFVDNVQKFTATESLVFESLNDRGQVARTERRTYDYVVSVEEPVAGMLAVNEYQNSRTSSGAARDLVVTRGLPALLLIFHPYYAGDFSMRCEGLTLWKGTPAWLIRFRQRDDRPSRIRSYKMGSGPAYGINLEGRAWFDADSYQIRKFEAGLIQAIPEIQLTVDDTSAEYGPVRFQSRGIEIWLPQTADLVSERAGKRFNERITFSDYFLFAVDNQQEIAPPKREEWVTGAEACLTQSGCYSSRLVPVPLHAVVQPIPPD